MTNAQIYLARFLEKESETFVKATGRALPAIEPLARQVSNALDVQRYVSTRLFYYGGGENPLNSAREWALEALEAPEVLD